MVITLFLFCLLPAEVCAQVGFGIGDEQQQLQQLQQLQGPARGGGGSVVPPRAASPVASGANVTSAAAEDAFGGAATTSNPVPTAGQAAGAALAAGGDPSQQTSAFIPYSGPSNRFTEMAPATQALNESAFSSVIATNFPMTTEQIHQLKQAYTASQEASAAAPGVPPRPTVTSQLVSIAPGSTPPVIRLAQGFVSSLVFVDSTGAPWPIEAYDIGNPSAFNIQWNHTDNTLMIQSMTLYTYGNLAVRLRGLPTPVMLTLIPGQRVIDYRVDLRIQGLGPNAKLPTSGEGPSSANPVLLSVLDGVPPPGGKSMVVNGGEAQAWLLQDKLFLRTRLTVLSPAWVSTMSSADGMKAYELQKTPMILASFHGKPIQLRIEGF
ncbi:MAG: DotH/IcmK family type IV secretion protein [Gammaproteobacteria bacterium]|nr:DotH/IcmK family type IV secretion protein [Gammaproteobacteria bacterium]